MTVGTSSVTTDEEPGDLIRRVTDRGTGGWMTRDKEDRTGREDEPGEVTRTLSSHW